LQSCLCLCHVIYGYSHLDDVASYWSESVNMVISICIWCLILQTAGKMALWVSCTQHKPISGVDPPWRFKPCV
jgi:hypothetical protein